MKTTFEERGALLKSTFQERVAEKYISLKSTFQESVAEKYISGTCAS